MSTQWIWIETSETEFHSVAKLLRNLGKGYTRNIGDYTSIKIEVTVLEQHFPELLERQIKLEQSRMLTQKFINADKIVEQLVSMDIDGETLEYIVREVGMANQLLRQLLLKTKQDEDIMQLLKEKSLLNK